MQNAVWRKQQIFEQRKRFDTRSNFARKFVSSMRTVQRVIEKIPDAFLIYLAIIFLIQDVNNLMLARNRRSI